jgi:hypothetical protein
LAFTIQKLMQVDMYALVQIIRFNTYLDKKWQECNTSAPQIQVDTRWLDQIIQPECTYQIHSMLLQELDESK